MRHIRMFLLPALLVCCLASPAPAHFGMVIPSADHAAQDQKALDVTLSFSHPFGGEGMELVKPKFGVYFEGQYTDLAGQLAKTKVMEHTGWKLNYAFKRPGPYVFYMEPTPYWSPPRTASSST